MRKSAAGVIALLALTLTSLSLAASSPSTADAGGSVASNVTSSASGQCSKAEAIDAVRRLGLSDVSQTYPVWKLLCGAFAGAESQTMVAFISGSGNVGMLYWAVFRWSGSEWQFLMKQRHAAVLAAVGSDIRETWSIYRVGDPRCCASGGTKSRTWHWNGRRFTASAWNQAAPPRGDDKVFPRTFFQTPSGNIVCEAYSGFDALEGGGQAFYAGVRCVIKSGLKPQPRHTCEVAGGFVLHQVTVGRTGGVAVPGCRDDASGARLLTKTTADVLGYGQTWSGGGLRCTSAVTGLTCRNKKGHGFFLSREHWRAF